MPSSSRIHVATGDSVVSLTLSGSRLSEVAGGLEGSGAVTLAVDPNDPLRAYAGTFDDGVYATDDAGWSWREAGAGIEDHRVLALAVSPSHAQDGVSVVYAGTEPSNLYRSEDAGRSWQLLPSLRELPSEPNWSFPGRPWTHHVKTIALHQTDPDWLLVGIELGGVMRSLDAGASWADHNPEAHSDAHRLLTHPLAPERVYEVAGQGVALSADEADSWSRFEDGLDRRYAWAGAIDPADPDDWYVAVSRSAFSAHGRGDGEARLMHSSGGAWSPVDAWGDEPELRRMPYALAVLPGRPGALLAGLRDGALLLGENAGADWKRLDLELSDLVDLAAAHRLRGRGNVETTVPDEIRHPLFARFYAWLAPVEDRAGVAEHRRDLVAGLRGRVLELGVGTGLSFRHYPPAVEQLVAVEPEPTMRANAAKAARRVALDVQLVDGTADALPAADASLDAVVVSQVLCSVPDQARALAELRRVLRPGGELRFYEHVLSPNEPGRRVQRALDATVWPLAMGGCHLGRDTAAAIDAAGFSVRHLRRFRIGPTPAAPHVLGLATAPS